MMDGPGSPGVTSSGGAPHVRRLRTLKRKKEEKDNSRNQVKLERVLGLTVSSNASLATAPATGNSSPHISSQPTNIAAISTQLVACYQALNGFCLEKYL